MPITLAQTKVGMANHIDQMVIDEFRRGSMLLDALTFDNSVSPGTGGSTLTYGYTRLKTPAKAAFRTINADYTPGEADRENVFATLKILGGAFEIDRVLARTSNKSIDEVEFQLKEKITATINTFHNCVINGDAAVDAKSFDGLNKMLTGSSTEYNKNAIIDLSTSAMVDANYKVFLDQLDEFLSELDAKPNMLLCNTKLAAKIRACARRAGYLTQSEDAFGRKVEGYNDIPFVDLGYFYGDGGSVPVIKIENRTVGTAQTGLTDLYAVRFGLDAFHGISPVGEKIVHTTLPDFNTAGTVKKGDVEMVGAVVLKKTRAAGVLRNIKVQ